MVSLNFYNSAKPKNDYNRPLEIKYVPGEIVNLKHVTIYYTITREYKSDPLEHKLIFSVSKLDINMWLSVVRQLCPEELRAVLTYRRATRWTNNPTETIIFDRNQRVQRVL